MKSKVQVEVVGTVSVKAVGPENSKYAGHYDLRRIKTGEVFDISDQRDRRGRLVEYSENWMEILDGTQVFEVGTGTGVEPESDDPKGLDPLAKARQAKADKKAAAELAAKQEAEKKPAPTEGDHSSTGNQSVI